MRDIPTPTFTASNESLEGIVKALEVSQGDEVLAVCGSGDQAFAFLEHTGKVDVIDKDPEQLELARFRASQLRDWDFTGFLAVPGGFDDSGRRSYFDRDRLLRIRENLDGLRLHAADIYNLPDSIAKDSYDKIYLSNTLEWPPEDWKKDHEEAAQSVIQELAEKQPIGGLIYMSESFYGKFVRDLEGVETYGKGTAVAREHEERWNPCVYVKLGPDKPDLSLVS